MTGADTLMRREDVGQIRLIVAVDTNHTRCTERRDDSVCAFCMYIVYACKYVCNSTFLNGFELKSSFLCSLSLIHHLVIRPSHLEINIEVTPFTHPIGANYLIILVDMFEKTLKGEEREGEEEKQKRKNKQQLTCLMSS